MIKKNFKTWQKVFYTFVIVFMALPFTALRAPQVVAQAAPSQGDGCALDIMLVMDRSGSMGGHCEGGIIPAFDPISCSVVGGIWTELLDDSKTAADGFVNNLNGDDQSGLVSYGESATTDQILTSTHSLTQIAINALSAGGGTLTHQAIAEASAILGASSSGAQPVMIILGDGDANDGSSSGSDPVYETLALTNASTAVGSGIGIWTVKYGDGSSTLFGNIADLSGNTGTYRATSPTDISDIYAEIEDAYCGEPKATVIAQKIVCNSETDLPNLSGGADITATTTQDFVTNSNGACRFEPNWKFEWGTNDSLLALNGDYTGEHNVPGWYDFDTLTDSNGTAQVVLNLDEMNNNQEPNKVWFREVLQPGYIPFTFTSDNDPVDPVSAEFWCNKDVLNYDNAEWVEGLEENDVVYCMAINVLKPQEPRENICGIKVNDKDKDMYQDENEESLSGWNITLQEKTQCEIGDEWADEVISYSPGTQKGGGALPDDRDNPSNALGVAQYNDTINFVSLGFGGELVLKFSNFIENGVGDDLEIVETSYNSPSCVNYPEQVRVFASQDGTNWTQLGEGCLDGTYDLGSLSWAQYVKLVDISDSSDSHFPNEADGYDIDGVRALNCLNAGEVVTTDTTDETGEYCFTDLEAGQYFVCEEMKEGWSNVSPLCHQVELIEENMSVSVDFFNYQSVIQEPTGDICGYKYKVDAQGNTLGTLPNWQMSLWEATDYYEQFYVDANDTDGVMPELLFASGKTYKIEVTGTALAGDGIEFDAKYSERNQSGSWTDLVQSYESYGVELLDLQINGVSPDWGMYTDTHKYFVIMNGDDSNWNFQINDIYYPNNTGSLQVEIYELEDTKQTAYTNDNGYYCFNDLADGHYVVEEGMKEGYSVYGSQYCQTFVGSVPKISFASVAPQVFDSSENICNFYNQEIEQPTGDIHGFKWNDENGNGERDCTDSEQPVCEPLMFGWTIFIDENDNGILDNEETSMDTSAGQEHFGWYWFENLPYDEYSICEVQQSGWTQTYPASCYTVTLPDGNSGGFEVLENATVGPAYNFGNYQDPGCTENCVTGGGTETSGGNPTSSSQPGPTVLGFTETFPTLEKSVDQAQVNPGGTLHYTVVVNNTSDQTLLNVVLTDTLPAGFTFADDGTTVRTWDIGLMDVGQVITYSYDVLTSPDLTAGMYANTAKLVYSKDDGMSAAATGDLQATAVLTYELIAEATVNVVPVQVLGYEALPDTGGPVAAVNYTWFGILLLGAGVYLVRRFDI